MNSTKPLKVTNWIYDLHWMANLLTLSLPEFLMEFFKVSLTCEYVDEIEWSNDVTIQMIVLCLYLHMALFIFQNLTKWNLEIWSKFAFG